MRVVVVTHIVTPYQVELFDAVQASGSIDLGVIYLADASTHRSWTGMERHHPCVDVTQGPASRAEGARWIDGADLVVIGHYRHPLALKWMQDRHQAARPWCFWGERPGFRFSGRIGRAFRAWKLSALRNSVAPIWGIGQWAVAGYQREFGTKRRFYNVPYWSDLERFSRMQPTELVPDGKRRVLFSGSLIKRKGIDLLAKSFRRFAASRPDLHLDILGDGPLRKALQAELAPVREKVAFHGFVQWDALPAYYRRADILCVPSRYDGWGLVVPEGLAAGLPVITTDRTGAGIDLVRHGENGWIAKAGDVDTLHESLNRAINLPIEELRAMSQMAVESVANHGLRDGAARFEEAVLGTLDAWRDISNNVPGEAHR